MLVEVEHLDAQLHVEKAAAPELDRGPSRVVERRARLPQAPVGRKLGRVVVRDLLKRFGSDLLLALDQEAQRDGHLAERLQGLERVDPRHHVGLVVGDAAGDDPPVFLNRLERRRVPQVDRVDWLHVVVLVEEQLAPSGARHLRVERRHAAGVERLHPIRVEARRLAIQRAIDRVLSMVEMPVNEHSLSSTDGATRALLDVLVDRAGRDHGAIVSPA